MESRGKPGTRPKGDRRAITVRVPREQFYDIVDNARRDAGYDNLSDYITALLAEEHGLEVPPYARRPERDHPLLEAG